MDEWTVVTALVVLLGLFAAVAKPIISLNSTITRLTDAVGVLEKNLEQIAGKNSEQHSRLWSHEARQDERLQELEMKVKMME